MNQEIFCVATTPDNYLITSIFPKNYLTKYMKPQKHIIQLWTGTGDSHIAHIVNNGFKTIFSTYDTLYLDCGYGNWLVKVCVYRCSKAMPISS